MPDDKNRPGPGEMISDIAYFEGTEHVRVAIHTKNESVLKLKGDMIPHSVKQGGKIIERYRYVYQLISAFRYKYREHNLMSKSVNK